MTRAASDSDVFFAIADSTRRRMLELLADGPRAVKELVAEFRISQPSISEHLRVLRSVGLVRVRRAGRTRVYRLNAEKLREIAAWVNLFSRFWHKRLDALSDYLERRFPESAQSVPAGAAAQPPRPTGTGSES